MSTRKNQTILSVVTVLAAVILFSLLMAFPLEASFRTETGNLVHAWYSKTFSKLFPLILAAVISLSALAWRWTGKALTGQSPRILQRINALRTLLWLPSVVLGGYTAPWIGIVAAGLFLPYGVSLICAWTIERLVGDSVSSYSAAQRPKIFTGSILAYFIFLLVAGLHFQHELGPRSGDEIHYLIQVRSLVNEGNLELSSEMTSEMGKLEKGVSPSTHIKINAEGELYSYHSFGLPLLAWPFGFLGVFGRQLLLALIGALAVAGVRAACLALKAPARASSLVSWTLAFSYVWAMYSVRFLPEILGCGLMAWAFWALISQKERRWASTVVALVCCGFLPYAHIRWAPPSLLLAAFFGIEGLFLANEKTSRKFIRLAFFAAGYAAFGLTLLYFHRRIFSGTQAYNYRDVLFAYPMGMWAIIADRRGLFAVLPALIWYIVSVPYCLVVNRAAALRAAEAGLLFAAILTTSCTTEAALGGACIPGRYLFTAVPILLPTASVMLSRSGKAARIWFYFLASIPVLFYGFVGSLLSETNRSYVHAPGIIREFIGFHSFWEPLALFGKAGSQGSIVFTTVFVLSLIALTFLLMTRLNNAMKTELCASLLVIAYSCGYQSHHLEPSSEDSGSGLLARTHNWKHYQAEGNPKADIVGLFSGSSSCSTKGGFTLSDSAKSADAPCRFISAPLSPRNDWAHRDLYWHGIRPTPVRHNFEGYILFRVVGTVKRGTGIFAVRQGAHTLDEGYELSEGPFDFTWIIETRKGWGFTEALASLKDNQGEVDVDYFQLVPYSPYMTSSGFVFPSSTLVRDLTAGK